MTRHWIFAFLLLFGQFCWGDSKINNLSSLNQDLFKDLTSDLGASLGYKAINPGQPLGMLGIEVSSSRMDLEATGGNSQSELLIPEIHLVKGLPFGIDVGAFYTALPSSDIALVGGEMGYALYEGNTFTPAVSIRGTFTSLTGVDDLKLFTRGLELSISKGFAAFTPYAGIGTVWVDGETTVSGLSDEYLRHQKYFLGFNLNLGSMNFAAETEQTGDSATTSAKIGARF